MTVLDAVTATASVNLIRATRADFCYLPAGLTPYAQRVPDAIFSLRYQSKPVMSVDSTMTGRAPTTGGYEILLNVAGLPSYWRPSTHGRVGGSAFRAFSSFVSDSTLRCRVQVAHSDRTPPRIVVTGDSTVATSVFAFVFVAPGISSVRRSNGPATASTTLTLTG